MTDGTNSLVFSALARILAYEKSCRTPFSSVRLTRSKMSKTKQSCSKAEGKIPMCKTKFCCTTMQLLHAIVLLESSVVQERFGSLSIVLIAQSSQILSQAHCRICLRAENTKLSVPSVKIVSDAKSYRPKYGLNLGQRPNW